MDNLVMVIESKIRFVDRLHLIKGNYVNAAWEYLINKYVNQSHVERFSQ